MGLWGTIGGGGSSFRRGVVLLQPTPGNAELPLGPRYPNFEVYTAREYLKA
jgi:hypothetical protein